MRPRRGMNSREAGIEAAEMAEVDGGGAIPAAVRLWFLISGETIRNTYEVCGPPWALFLLISMAACRIICRAAGR